MGEAEPLASSTPSEMTTSVRRRGWWPITGARVAWARSAARATPAASRSVPSWKWMRKCSVSVVRQRHSGG
jgi:hypothetical protein